MIRSLLPSCQCQGSFRSFLCFVVSILFSCSLRLCSSEIISWVENAQLDWSQTLDRRIADMNLTQQGMFSSTLGRLCTLHIRVCTIRQRPKRSTHEIGLFCVRMGLESSISLTCPNLKISCTHCNISLARTVSCVLRYRRFTGPITSIFPPDLMWRSLSISITNLLSCGAVHSRPENETDFISTIFCCRSGVSVTLQTDYISSFRCWLELCFDPFESYFEFAVFFILDVSLHLSIMLYCFFFLRVWLIYYFIYSSEI